MNDKTTKLQSLKKELKKFGLNPLEWDISLKLKGSKLSVKNRRDPQFSFTGLMGTNNQIKSLDLTSL